MVLNFIVFKLICLTQIELNVQCKKNNVLKIRHGIRYWLHANDVVSFVSDGLYYFQYI